MRSEPCLKQKFGIGKTAVYDVINDRKAILEQCEDEADPKKKHMKFTDKPINNAILSWTEPKSLSHRSSLLPKLQKHWTFFNHLWSKMRATKQSFWLIRSKRSLIPSACNALLRQRFPISFVSVYFYYVC